MTVERRRYNWIFQILFMLVIIGFFNYHYQKIHIPISWIMTVNLLSFGWILALIYLSHANKTYTAKRRDTDGFNVAVIVPFFNEDPATFARMLQTINQQTRQPESICIIDDGSTNKECKRVFDAWRPKPGVKVRYIHQENMGKREAQAKGFRAMKDADIYVTMDSDTVLDPAAIENGIMPFVDRKVMSAAGLLLGLNDRANLLTRLIDLGFVSSFLNGRAAWSHMNSVAVNCGGLALYRAEVVHNHLEEYINQTVMGKRATCGDDRILTNFALLEGKTVFQESCVGYTLLPVNLKHLTKQRIRWWRSFFWGSVWLTKRFPMHRLVWWLVSLQLVSFAVYTIIVPYALLYSPIINQKWPIEFFIYIFALSYLRNMRYLAVKRSDQSLRQQLTTFGLAPISTLLHMYLCNVLQYAGLLTFHHMGWGTRKKVEVGIGAQRGLWATMKHGLCAIYMQWSLIKPRIFPRHDASAPYGEMRPA